MPDLSRAGLGIDAEDAARAAMFEDFKIRRLQRAAPVACRETGGGVGQPDRPVRRKIQTVRVGDDVARCRCLRHHLRPGVGHAQEAAHGVGDPDGSVRRDLYAQRAALDGRENLGLAVRRKAQDVALARGHINRAVGTDGGVLRSVAAHDFNPLKPGEAVIG